MALIVTNHTQTLQLKIKVRHTELMNLKHISFVVNKKHYYSYEK